MRILGWLAMVLGVLGLVICVAIAVGVWVIRPSIDDGVTNVVAIASKGIDQADELTVQVSDAVTRTAEALDSIASTAQSVADSPLVDNAVGQAIRRSISRLASGPQGEIMTSAAALRERVVGLSDTVQQLDAAIPFIELPGTVTGAVTDLDARLTELDQTMQTIDTVAGDGITTGEQATNIATAAAQASERLTAVNETLVVVQGRLDEIDAQVVAAGERVHDLLGWAFLAICIVAIWVGLLHVLLVADGRRWARDEA